MKNKIKNITKVIHKQNGLVIVEAAIVFPVMFFVLFFIIFIGNMYYEQAKVDSIVLKYSVKGAEYIANPFQENVEKNNKISTEVKGLNIEPYRYILGTFTSGTVKKVEENISKSVKNEINNNAMIFFSNSKADITGSNNAQIAKYENHILYSKFIVQVNYKVKFPIRFFGDSNPTIAILSSRSEVSVNDSPEFIRNADMAIDILDRTSLPSTIEGIFKKIKGFMNKFK